MGGRAGMDPSLAAAPPPQIKLLTLAFAPALGTIDVRPLESFLADKELLQIREHLFSVQELRRAPCQTREFAAIALPSPPVPSGETRPRATPAPPPRVRAYRRYRDRPRPFRGRRGPR